MLSRFFGINGKPDDSPVKDPAPQAVALSPAPRLTTVDFEFATEQMSLEPATLAERKASALNIVERHHQRIANTIRALWGYRECSAYINKLIMEGGDGMGHARVGFNQDAVQAMLELSDLHDAEFGPPESIVGGLGLSI